MSLSFVLKKIWPLFVVIPLCLFAYRFFVSKKNMYELDISALRDIHQLEIDKINAIREEEKKLHEQNLKRLQDTLDSVQKKYDDSIKQLDEKQKKRVEKIVKKYSNDTKGLAEELSKSTGFEIVLPEKKP